MVSGELAGEGLQTGFSRHGLPPQRALLDTVYPLREHLNSVQRMVSEGCCEGLFPDTVCWTRLRNTWEMRQNGSCFIGKEERPKCVRNPSKLRQKCVKNAGNTFGGEHLSDDTEDIED